MTGYAGGGILPAMDRVRRPAVAGTFYPSSAREVERFLAAVMPQRQRERAVAVVSPHAGYIYSGETAGEVFSRVEVPDTVIVMGPNHRGRGSPYAVDDNDWWETPLGRIRIDRDLSSLLLDESSLLKADAHAGTAEHSLEVQIPFIQYANPRASLVAICLQGYPDDPAFRRIGEAIASVVKRTGREVLLVASSDMTHYEPRRVAEEKDRAALEAIASLDDRLLIERIVTMGISMCGYGPVVVALTAARMLGARRGDVVRYATSGDVTDDDEVVGYAGVIIR